MKGKFSEAMISALLAGIVWGLAWALMPWQEYLVGSAVMAGVMGAIWGYVSIMFDEWKLEWKSGTVFASAHFFISMPIQVLGDLSHIWYSPAVLVGVFCAWEAAYWFVVGGFKALEYLMSD